MIANNVYFITTDYLKKYYSGYLDPNIDANALDSFILIAQGIRIQSVLGFDLYNKYITDINNNTGPVGQYKYLMDNYIQPATALYSIYEALPSLNFRITNKAVSQKSSDYGQPSTRTDVEYLRQQVVNNAEFYSMRIREYITNNPSDFPEYYITTGVNRIRAKNNNYFGGLYLPDVVRRPGTYGGWSQDERCAGCGVGNGYFLN